MKSVMERILSNIGLENIIETLSSKNIDWADFHTLLLCIFENRIHNINPADIMKNYKENRFSATADIDQKELLEIDRMLYRALPGYFSAIELSPVSVMGANSALTPLDPKITLSTIRNLEVVSDPSMALSIECAHKRRLLRATKENTEIHLATSHRVLRLQKFLEDSNLTTHFRAFALASAARDTAGFNSFELFSISAHIETWLDFLIRSFDSGYKVEDISVAISDIRIIEKVVLNSRINREELIRKSKNRTFSPFKTYSINLPDEIDSAGDIAITALEFETYIRELQFTEKQIINSLRKKYPMVRFYFDLKRCSGIGYYSGICYRVAGRNSAGNQYSLAGGGACDWTKKLLQSKREHLIASGFGTEFFSKLFGHNRSHNPSHK